MTTTTHNRTPKTVLWALLVTAAAVLLAACGSSSGGTASTSQGSKVPAAAGASSGAVATGTTDVGTVLVDGSGKTLYAFAADTRGTSNCSGSCAQYWPPVTAKAGSLGHSAAVTARLGTITRDDGSTQLTVDGWPMYTYAGDSAAGQATGQGKNLSGGLWWVVKPSGAWLKKTSGTSPVPMGY